MWVCLCKRMHVLTALPCRNLDAKIGMEFTPYAIMLQSIWTRIHRHSFPRFGEVKLAGVVVLQHKTMDAVQISRVHRRIRPRIEGFLSRIPSFLVGVVNYRFDLEGVDVSVGDEGQVKS